MNKNARKERLLGIMNSHTDNNKICIAIDNLIDEEVKEAVAKRNNADVVEKKVAEIFSNWCAILVVAGGLYAAWSFGHNILLKQEKYELAETQACTNGQLKECTDGWLRVNTGWCPPN